MTSTPDEVAAEYAHQSLASGEVTGWFEPLYAAAARGDAVIPWDKGEPHPLLVQWARARERHTGRALVVGTGLGHDAEYVASLGYRTDAFDVSASAIAAARAAYPDSRVDYRVADLFDLPGDWRGAFDLVVESMTVQAMPREVRSRAIASIRPLVAPGGILLVIGMHLPQGQGLQEGPPWPLTEDELAQFVADGLQGELVTEHRADAVDRYRYELTRSR